MVFFIGLLVGFLFGIIATKKKKGYWNNLIKIYENECAIKSKIKAKIRNLKYEKNKNLKSEQIKYAIEILKELLKEEHE